ncbi:ABC transporter ATP-binding protein [Treponema pedis]|uniref:ABC transporter ATP-binding protein n=1 Tax=Treponema pedis TaxID=409322 RepID=A0A7S6WN57_9SPIR|nr:ABC transporter ATP-binding protein [Treponema pedis]QOW60213.1 ABC transporter ATP-binding protein [Treponema pedis]
MKEEIKTHGILSNILFYAKIWVKVFPIGLIILTASVPLRILQIYETIRIPRIIIAGIETSSEPKTVLMSVIFAALIITALKIILQVFETSMMALGSRPLFYLYTVPINEKMFNMRYQTLISEEVQTKLIKVKNIVMSGSNGGPFHFLAFNLSFFLTAVTGLIIFSPGIIKIDIILLIIILVSGLFNLLYGIYTGKYTRKNMNDRAADEKKENYIIQTAEDKLFSKDIRMYNMKSWLIENFKTYHEKHSAYLKKETLVKIGGKILNALTVFTRDIFAYIYLIYKLSTGVIAISEFVFLIALVMEFSKWMDAIVLQINNLIVFSAQADHIRDFLETKDKYSEGSLLENAVSEKPSIEFNNISYRYSEKSAWIFKNFNLKINPGEKLALVGVNGAGKTTLMHLLMGLLEPVEGEILIDGKPSSSFKKTEYYSLFSPVFQDINIFPETISANIAGSETFDEQKLNDAIITSGLAETVKSLPDGKETFLIKTSRDEAIDLSGGQNQRMLLARALYKNAKINILDEPTAALDPIAESRIYEEYDSMSKDKTSIFISHRLASTRFCNRIIFLEYGKIIEEGSHDELMSRSSKYREMYEIQSKYYQEEKEELKGENNDN